MAIFHLSVKAISRSAGRTSTAAAAYRAGVSITDTRTGETHDYTRKRGIDYTHILVPKGTDCAWATDRAALWNAAEAAEKRKDACVAREYEVALPSELSPGARRRLVLDFAQEMASAEGCAVDIAIHQPSRGGDNRNHHAHILRTTRKVGPDGKLTDKLDTEKAGRGRRNDLEAVRARWAELCNEHLRDAGIEARVDHRSLDAQGVDREPTRHLGPTATGIERRTGQPSRKRLDFEQDATERLVAAKEAGLLERAQHQVERSILDLSGDLNRAIEQKRAEERARRAQEALAQEFRIDTAKAVEVAPMSLQVDYRGMLIAEVNRLTSGQAECFEKDGIRSTGTVFAVNDRFAAQDTGRLRVRIIDRTQIAVGLGEWTVEVNGGIKAGQLRDGGRRLQQIYGKGVTEQLERVTDLGLSLSLSRGQGIVR